MEIIIRKCRTKGALEAIPERNIQMNLNKIKSKFDVIADLPILVIIKINNYNITCYKNGKLVIRNCTEVKEANKIAEEIYRTAE